MRAEGSAASAGTLVTGQWGPLSSRIEELTKGGNLECSPHALERQGRGGGDDSGGWLDKTSSDKLEGVFLRPVEMLVASNG